MTLSYRTLSYTDLSLDQLYRILQLRQEVFVVEQDCPYLDADGKDQASYHVLSEDTEGNIVAYVRLVPQGVSYENYVSIGRVVTSESIRGRGHGVTLMNYSVDAASELWPAQPIKISAQAHLQSFYQKMGFEPVGEGYLEDNIPHIAMVVGGRSGT